MNQNGKTSVWQQACTQFITKQIPSWEYSTWFHNVNFKMTNASTAVLAVQGQHKKEMLVSRWFELIKSSLQQIDPLINNVKILTVAEEEAEAKDFITAQPCVGPSKQGKNDYHSTFLSEDYTFDSFIVSANNDFAYAACWAVSQNPGKDYNPLFLHGGSGLGKTHLLYAIGNRIRQIKPDLKVLYVRSETFLNDFVSCVKDSTKFDAFYRKYRLIDVLLIDDIQTLEYKEAMQEQIFHVFNDLYANNKCIVITSDKPPKQLKTLEERLVSRFGSGTVIEINKPDIETRLALTETFATDFGLNLESDAIDYIASNISDNVRELCGAVKTISAYAKLKNKKQVPLETIMDLLKDIIHPGAHKPLTLENVINVVSNYYGVTETELTSTKRDKNIVKPRFVAMYFCRTFLGMNYGEISGNFNRKDHTTSINACKSIKADLETDLRLQKSIVEIKKRLGLAT